MAPVQHHAFTVMRRGNERDYFSDVFAYGLRAHKLGGTEIPLGNRQE